MGKLALAEAFPVFEEYEITEQFLNVRGHDICIRCCGPEDGKVILFLHGIQSHAGVWDEISKLLAGNGYRVIAFDRRGHGYSGHTETYYLFDYVADLDAVVRKIVAKPFILVGHCESSIISALYAGAFPQNIENLLFIQFPIAPRKSMDDSIKADLLKTFLSQLSVQYQHQIIENIEIAAERSNQGAVFPMPKDVALNVAKRNIMPHHAGCIWRWDPRVLHYRLLYNTLDMSIVGTSLMKTASPVTFIYGRESSLMKHDKDRHLIVTESLKPSARQELIPGGHYPHLDGHVEDLMDVIISSIEG